MALHRYMDRLVQIYDATWTDIHELTRMIIGKTSAADVLRILCAQGNLDLVPPDRRTEGTGLLYCQRLPR